VLFSRILSRRGRETKEDIFDQKKWGDRVVTSGGETSLRARSKDSWCLFPEKGKEESSRHQPVWTKRGAVVGKKYAWEDYWQCGNHNQGQGGGGREVFDLYCNPGREKDQTDNRGNGQERSKFQVRKNEKSSGKSLMTTRRLLPMLLGTRGR